MNNEIISRFRAGALRTALALCVCLALAACTTNTGCNTVRTPEGWSTGAVSGDNLFIGTQQGEILAVEKQTGDLVWRRELPTREDSDRAIYGRVAVTDAAVFVGGYDGILYAYDSNGDPMWQEPLSGRIVGGPTVHSGYVFVGSGDVSSGAGVEGSLYAIDIATDDPVWTYSVGGAIWSPPTVSDGVVYAGSLDHSVYAVNAETGDAMWSFQSGGAVTSGLAVAGGLVIFGGFDSTLYALDAKTGDLVWRFDGASGWYWSTPLVADGVAYAPSLDGVLYAIDADTGDLVWLFDSDGGQIVGSPVFVNGLIAVPVADGGNSRIALLEPNGSFLAACRIDDDVRTSLESDGDLLYFSSKDSSIRALRIKGNGNPDEEWIFLTNEDDPRPSDRAKAC